MDTLDLTFSFHFMFSHVGLFATPWTLACQTSLIRKFSGQEYWSSLLFSSPEYLPNTGIESTSLGSSALADKFFTTEPLSRATLLNYVIWSGKLPGRLYPAGDLKITKGWRRWGDFSIFSNSHLSLKMGCIYIIFFPKQLLFDVWPCDIEKWWHQCPLYLK